MPLSGVVGGTPLSPVRERPVAAVPTAAPGARAGFLAGPGEMPALIHAHDWSATPLGPLHAWPRSLRTAVGMMLRSPVAMILLWGRDGTMIYNDGFAVFAGRRHPWLLGKVVSEGWPEVAEFNAEVMRAGLAGGTLSYRDQEMTLLRNGEAEQVWMDLDYSPVPGEDEAPAGVIAVVVETTERVRAEQAQRALEATLRVERDRARGVLENMGEGFVLLDRAFRVVDINAEALRLDGRLRQEIVGLTQAQAWPATRASAVGAACRRAMAGRVPVVLEHRHAWPDGRDAWLELRVYPTEGGLALFQRDVSERRRDEQALRDSEQRLRDLNADLERQVLERTLDRGRTWHVSPDLLGVVGADGRFGSVNPAWQAVLGWSVEEIMRTPFLDFVHPEDRARTLAVWQELLDGEPVLRFENRWATKGGGWRWLSWVSVPEGDKTYCSARDVTAGREQAARLAERTAERDRLWRNTQDLQVVVDKAGTFVDVNPAVTRVLGWTAEEMVGRSAFEFVLPDDEALTSTALHVAGERALRTLENRYRHRDGGIRWVSWVAAPEGELIYASGRHVTAEKEQAAELALAQEALRQAQKMEAVGQLTGGLAHDFNNLLTGVMGSLELLQVRVAQGRFGEVGRLVDAAQGAARRAASLTHRLLAFSRRQTLDPKVTDANRLVDGMAELVSRTMGPEIAVERLAAEGLWATLVDPGQLENALLNLCINARDAMPGGGTLTVATENLTLDERAAREREVAPGQYVCLCVGDTGTGMAAEVVARAFEPFFTTKPVGQGTGLGLSMIYGFVRQSGGQVQIRSEVGRGTTVCLLLPRHAGEAEQAEAVSLPRAAADAPRAAQAQSVLVVDDEASVRMLVVEVLEDLGYGVLEAEAGAAGLAILQSGVRVDLLVTDVGLPGGMNGRQLADAARVARADLKVLFITGYAEQAVLGQGQLGEGMQVMTKPFALEALASRVRGMIEG